jgi:hypothetical protein
MPQLDSDSDSADSDSNSEPGDTGSGNAAPWPSGSITDRLLTDEGGLDRLCEPLGTRFESRPGDSGPGGGSFTRYPGWDEKPHPWSQRAGSGHTDAETSTA